MQSKKNSFIEAWANTLSGFMLGLFLGYFVLPYFGVEQDIIISIQITMIYTIASVIRNYIIRRVFNK